MTAPSTNSDDEGSLPRKTRSLAVRKAAAEVAIQAAKNQGKEPDPRLLELLGRSA